MSNLRVTIRDDSGNECPIENIRTFDSGYGYEGGIEGVEAYLHKKLVSLA